MTDPLAQRSFGDLLDQIGARAPTPGGGAVASAVGALGAALGEMVLAYSIGKKSLAEHDAAHRDALQRLVTTRALLLALAAEDESAYGLVNELSRLPEDDPRRAELPAATLEAARVPLSCLAAGVGMLRLLVTLAPITNKYLRSDLAIAAVLGEAAARSAAWNVEVNLPGLTDEGERAKLASECGRLVACAGELCAEVERACRGAEG